MNSLPATILASLAIIISLHNSPGSTLLLDFEATSGDRQAQFGSGNYTGGATVYDNASSTTGNFFVQSGGLKYQISSSYTANSSWIVLDDAQPTVVNSSRPSGYTEFLYGSSMVVRSRVSTLTSGVGGTSASGGIFIGLSDNGSSDSGLFFSLQNNVNGAGSDYIRLNTLSSGTIGSSLNSAAFEYGSSSTPYFFELTLTPNIDGTSTDYVFELFADTAISGTGGDANRLLSADFGTATSLASISGTLSSSQYTSGYVAMAYSSTSTNTSGQVVYDNFYINAATVPEPATVATLSLSLFGVMLLHISRRRPALTR